MIRNIITRAFITPKSNNALKCVVNRIRNIREIHCGLCLRNPRQTSKSNKTASPAIASKYEVISEDNSLVIENTADEMYQENPYPILSDEFDGINLNRGQSGVFEIYELIELLQRENSKNIFVAAVPHEINYVDYIVIVSGRSKRHVQALAEFVRKVYKKKCFKSDPIPRLEGKNSDEWIALDLGNIALHVFSDKTRESYDLETLWAVGPEYDDLTKKKSDIDILENYSAYLKDLQPLS